MAKSKAKKQREKWQREGHLNPEINRGTWGSVNPITKRTPTLIEKQFKFHTKHKKRFTQGEHALDKPFLFELVSKRNTTKSELNYEKTSFPISPSRISKLRVNLGCDTVNLFDR